MNYRFSLRTLALSLSLALAAMPVVWAADTESSPGKAAASADYAAGKQAVEQKLWLQAAESFRRATLQDPKNADAWNMLGYTHRMLGHMEESSKAYLVVLTINPDHLGALEYQGELFLQTGKPDLAKANLAKLQGLCGTCEQFQDLQKAITAAGA